MCLRIFDKAESFSKYTFEHYATYEDFLNSDQKYVSQFNIKRKSTSNAKKILKLEIIKLMQQRSITQYQVATKYLHTSQSNVSQFFNKNNDSALSYEKLKKLYMELLK